MIISRTPYRVSFLGGGTDYPAWYREHGGAVLAATIDKYCYLSCRSLPPFFQHSLRVVYSQVECCQSLDEISHPAAREALAAMIREGRLDGPSAICVRLNAVGEGVDDDLDVLAGARVHGVLLPKVVER